MCYMAIVTDFCHQSWHGLTLNCAKLLRRKEPQQEHIGESQEIDGKMICSRANPGEWVGSDVSAFRLAFVNEGCVLPMLRSSRFFVKPQCFVWRIRPQLFDLNGVTPSRG